MPKHNAITYENFEKVADEFIVSGFKASKLTIEMMQAKVGGSNSTIIKFLRQYREAHPEPRSPVRILPEGVASSIHVAIERAETAARADSEEKLTILQHEVSVAVAEAERMDAELEDFREQAKRLATERDMLAGQKDQQALELIALKADLANEHEKATTAERELYVARSVVQTSEGRLAEIREQFSDQMAKATVELQAARGDLSASIQRVAEAEKVAVVAEAHLESERKAKLASDARMAELTTTVQHLQEIVSKAAADGATNAELRQQLKMMQNNASLLEGLVINKRVEGGKVGASKACENLESALTSLDAPH